MLAFGNDEDYKRFKKAKKNYETIEFNNFIGEIIKNKRKELNISPADIALTLNITYNAYNQYENGRINIPPENLFKITKILNISLDECKEFYFNIKKYKESFKQKQISPLNKKIDIVKEIYKSGDKKLISALNNNLDIYYSLLQKDKN